MIVSIVYGGYSSEKDMSTENAHYIREALRECGYETHLVPYERRFWNRREFHLPEVVLMLRQSSMTKYCVSFTLTVVVSVHPNGRF